MDENGTESGGVDAQIPVTASVDASGYENVSRLDPLSFWTVFLTPRSPSLSCKCLSWSETTRLSVGLRGLSWSETPRLSVKISVGLRHRGSRELSVGLRHRVSQLV